MKNRTAVAYLLLLSMMPFFFVKAFHVHKECACIHDGQQFPHHDSADKCAICLFTLSLFTEAESLEYTHTLTVKPVKYLILEEQVFFWLCYFFLMHLATSCYIPIISGYK